MLTLKLNLHGTSISATVWIQKVQWNKNCNFNYENYKCVSFFLCPKTPEQNKEKREKKKKKQNNFPILLITNCAVNGMNLAKYI